MERHRPERGHARVRTEAGAALQAGRGPIPETIASALQTEIMTGRYRPGARLVEREIASRFRVSSIPVREALQILETRGLVIKRPNRGCSVIDLTRAEIEQMCELRDVLEPKVAEWAACRISEAGAERLNAQLAKLREAAESGRVADFFFEDLEFHRIIWELAENPSAARALETLVGSLFACGLRDASVDLMQQYRRHERLCHAIADGRPSDASLLLRSISGQFCTYLSRGRGSDDAAQQSED